MQFGDPRHFLALIAKGVGDGLQGTVLRAFAVMDAGPINLDLIFANFDGFAVAAP